MKNISAYETEAIVDASASVRITQLPFAAGQRVRVLVMEDSVPTGIHHTDEEINLSKMMRKGLKGSVLRYDDPFEPACPPDDWEAVSGTGLI